MLQPEQHRHFYSRIMLYVGMLSDRMTDIGQYRKLQYMPASHQGRLMPYV